MPEGTEAEQATLSRTSPAKPHNELPRSPLETLANPPPAALFPIASPDGNEVCQAVARKIVPIRCREQLIDRKLVHLRTQEHVATRIAPGA